MVSIPWETLESILWIPTPVPAKRSFRQTSRSPMWADCRLERSEDWSLLAEISGARTHEFLCGFNGSKNKIQALPRLKSIPFKRVIGRSEVPTSGRIDGSQGPSG